MYKVHNIYNSLTNEMVQADTTNTFKNRLNKYYINTEVFFIITRI